MQIQDMQLNAELDEILEEFRTQLHINGFPYLEKEPKRSGRSLQVQCPYHSDGQERNRSAGIRMSDGMFHCFACGEIHSLPEVISYCFGKSDMMFGWKWLLKNFATISVEERSGLDLDFSRNSLRGVGDKNYVTEEELDSYRYEHSYWTKRKITDKYLIELFDLGYDPKTKCITFPVRDENGNCLFVARRSVQYKYFNYPKNVEKPLYGLYELKQVLAQREEYIIPEYAGIDSVIVCESMLDALTCWQYGKAAVALNGTGNELQMKQLKQLPGRELIVATDNDTAGIKARERIRSAITNKLVYFYDIPRICRDNGDITKDINDLTKQEFLNLEKYL